MRVKIINPPFVIKNKASCVNHPNIAITVLKSFLNSKGFNVDQQDLNLYRKYQGLADKNMEDYYIKEKKGLHG